MAVTHISIKLEKGDVKIKLRPDLAPNHVQRIIELTTEGFYNGIVFHRVIPNFMIQGGDPDGTGRGGPGYQFEDEIVSSLVFDAPGKLAMANAGPNTNGSQFFITTVATPHLNGNHTIFGTVTTGQDIVETISKVDTMPGDKPVDDVVIAGIDIDES